MRGKKRAEEGRGRRGYHGDEVSEELEEGQEVFAVALLRGALSVDGHVAQAEEEVVDSRGSREEAPGN